MEEVSLHIDNHIFKVKKEILCEHSDYFRAMFSGNYVENDKRDIKIDVVDANSMKIIIQYMNNGLIDLSEYTLSVIADLSVAANYLQLPELIKQIEYCLDLQLSLSNWMQTMTIAESSSYTRLEQLSAAFGLLSFKEMRPEYVPSIKKLYWYLSHPFLDAPNELEVFKFGLQWVSNTETGADAVLLVLCCLDIQRLTTPDLKEIKILVADYTNSLASKVVDCIYELSVGDYELTTPVLIKQKPTLCEMFTERVYNEVFNLMKESRSRELRYIPSVPVWMVKNTKPEVIPHYMYTYTEEKGFEKWIEVAEKNLWGWSIVEWGPTRLVVVCGEHGKGTGVFMKDVKVYDTLRKEWTHHGVELPARRHGGVTVIGDEMYLVGGVGGFRVVLDTAVVYDLKQRTYRKIAKLPDTIQNPAICTHNTVVYAAGHKNIYRYDEFEQTDRWSMVIDTDFRTSCMVSFNNYIYCTQNYFSHFHRFRPNIDTKLEMITYFTNPPATICHLGTRLIVFTRTMCGQADNLAVEEYTGTNANERPRLLWSESNTVMKVNDVAGSCTLVLSLPPLHPEESQYHNRYLNIYANL
ncbi:unnamed protein product [Diatraea saccharalis]|uniref:BTB domain-containing protein n=1 Tax=Diatraea saccharalis TaxID=40085 RepID=A0A9N9R3X5_9NEOP|nr:unnamed protein product [Diatraea saccharalis]